MEPVELLLGLLAAIAVVVALAPWTRVPHPILLVVIGIGIGLVPGLPRVELDPDLTLLVFLPPLLYWAALHIPVREVRANLRPISLLAVGLVLVTMGSVAVLAHAAFRLPWAVAFTLGAIVAPPDPVAAVAIAERLGLSQRIVTILEGEGLLNDATALVAYKLAVAAAVSGTFSLAEAGGRLLLAGVGGTLLGVAAGWGGHHVLRRVREPPVENMVNLLIPFAAYLAAERIGASGVLSVLACGLWMSQHSRDAITSAGRVQRQQVWDMLVFILEGLSFILIGLQLREVVAGLGGRSVTGLLADALLLNLVVVAVRPFWVFPAAWLPRRLSTRLRERDPWPGWRATAVLAWAGMRGVVSLALALAIPRQVAGGAPFPERELVVFLAFSVIVVTLVGQGLTLPALIARLGVAEPSERRAREETDAMARVAEAALVRLDQLEAETSDVPPELVDRLRHRYRTRAEVLARHSDDDRADGMAAYRRLARELLRAQHEELRRLQREEGVSPSVVGKVRHDLDAEESRLDRLDGSS
jgi:CPA1 family monovalent cation:H+ antiporter